jgi:hypothetical protein
MKTFLVLVLTVVALFLWQRGGEPVVSKGSSVANNPVAPPIATQPVSEQNWAKHSIDRAREVVGQVRVAQEQSQH